MSEHDLIQKDLTAFDLRGNGKKIVALLDEYIEYYRRATGHIPTSITVSRHQLTELNHSLSGWADRVHKAGKPRPDVPNALDCTYNGIPVRVAG